MTRQEYKQQCHDLRDERHNWHMHPMAEVFSFYEVLQMRMEENPTPAVRSLGCKFDELQDREYAAQAATVWGKHFNLREYLGL